MLVIVGGCWSHFLLTEGPELLSMAASNTEAALSYPLDDCNLQIQLQEYVGLESALNYGIFGYIKVFHWECCQLLLSCMCKESWSIIKIWSIK